MPCFYARRGVGGDNFAVVRSYLDVFNRHDLERSVEFFHRDAEVFPSPSRLTPPGTIYRGSAGIRTWLTSAFPHKPQAHIESFHTFGDLPDEVLVTTSVVTEGDRTPLKLATVITVRDGKIYRAEGFLTQAEARAARRRTNDRFDSLFGRASDAIVLCDDKGHLTDANLTAAGFFGLELEELRNRTIFEVAPPQLVTGLERLWANLQRDGQFGAEPGFVSRRGESYPIEVRSMSNFAPGRHLILLTTRAEKRPSPGDPAEGSRLLLPAGRLGDKRGGSAGSGEGAEPRPYLTARELQVLQLAAHGRSTSEIADTLYLSAVTVKTHFQHIYKKLGRHDRAAALAQGLRLGLIE